MKCSNPETLNCLWDPARCVTHPMYGEIVPTGERGDPLAEEPDIRIPAWRKRLTARDETSRVTGND